MNFNFFGEYIGYLLPFSFLVHCMIRIHFKYSECSVNLDIFKYFINDIN